MKLFIFLKTYEEIFNYTSWSFFFIYMRLPYLCQRILKMIKGLNPDKHCGP